MKRTENHYQKGAVWVSYSWRVDATMTRNNGGDSMVLVNGHRDIPGRVGGVAVELSAFTCSVTSTRIDLEANSTYTHMHTTVNSIMSNVCLFALSHFSGAHIQRHSLQPWQFSEAVTRNLKEIRDHSQSEGS